MLLNSEAEILIYLFDIFFFNFFLILSDPICNDTKVTGALRNCSSAVWNSKRESYQFANYSEGDQKYTCNLSCSTQSYSKKDKHAWCKRKRYAREATFEPHG